MPTMRIKANYRLQKDIIMNGLQSGCLKAKQKAYVSLKQNRGKQAKPALRSILTQTSIG